MTSGSLEGRDCCEHADATAGCVGHTSRSRRSGTTRRMDDGPYRSRTRFSQLIGPAARSSLSVTDGRRSQIAQRRLRSVSWLRTNRRTLTNRRG
jgi:hypothetical protein